MSGKKQFLSDASRIRRRITSPQTWARAANSAKSKAVKLVRNVRAKLDSPTYKRGGRLPSRRVESVDRFSSNLNNVDQNSYETSSMQTTSTSSSVHSGFLSFALPTTVNPNDPLPLPTCRLGVYQAEWLGETEGVWKLITENATTAPVEQFDSHTDDPRVLKRVNKALKEEQEFLKVKLAVLYDELAKKTALVHQNDEQLENLRQRIKQELGETPESMRSSLRRELEQEMENAKLKIVKPELNELVDDKVDGETVNTPAIVSSSTSSDTLSDRKSEHRLVSRQKKISKSNDSESLNERLSQTYSETKDTVPTSRISVSSTGEVSVNDTTLTAQDTSQSDQTETADETMENGTEEEETDETSDESNKDSESVEEEEEEEEETEEDEDLSATEESVTESQTTSRRRVVQFGKVSRR